HQDLSFEKCKFARFKRGFSLIMWETQGERDFLGGVAPIGKHPWESVWSIECANLHQAVKLISAARVKTDARDTIKLASLLAANLIPAIWVPPHAVRELRALVAHRKRIVKPRTQAGNRLHGILHRHNLTVPPGKPFAAHQREWWLSLELS